MGVRRAGGAGLAAVADDAAVAAETAAEAAEAAKRTVECRDAAVDSGQPARRRRRTPATVLGLRGHWPKLATPDRLGGARSSPRRHARHACMQPEAGRQAGRHARTHAEPSKRVLFVWSPHAPLAQPPTLRLWLSSCWSDHGLRRDLLNDHLSIFSNNFIKFIYNIIYKYYNYLTLKLCYNYIILKSFNFI